MSATNARARTAMWNPHGINVEINLALQWSTSIQI
jgi:hypothetical protein